MYGPGSYWPWGPPPPPNGQPPTVIYLQQPPKQGKGRGKNYNPRNQPNPVDIFQYLEQAQTNLDKAKKMFKEEDKKKEEKKDDSSPLTKKRFSLLETVAFNFIFGLPTSFILFLVYKALTKLV